MGDCRVVLSTKAGTMFLPIKLLYVPTSHVVNSLFGALSGTRTHTLRSLKPLTLPIGLSEHLMLKRVSPPLTDQLQYVRSTNQSPVAYKKANCYPWPQSDMFQSLLPYSGLLIALGALLRELLLSTYFPYMTINYGLKHHAATNPLITLFQHAFLING